MARTQEMDQHIFDQLDQLERGACDGGRPHNGGGYHNGSIKYSGYDSYGTGYLHAPVHEYAEDYGHMPQEFVDEPEQLDAFDEQLLRQPDHNSRHGQAALGRARLSLAPGGSAVDLRHQLPTRSHQELSASWRPGLSRPALESEYIGPSSSSPLQRYTPPANDFQSREPSYDNRTALGLHPQNPEEPSSDDRFLPEIPTRNPIPAFQSTRAPHSRNPNVPVVQGISLVSTREVPDRFRPIFPFPLFNAVQSKCFGIVYKTNDNFVVSAPTGSGKTAVLELAICRLVNGFNNGSFKIVYQAPTKSLCSERQRDWQAKFGPLDLQCAELTGDTDSAHLRNVQHASIIITTPEKWDSVTRKWKDHQKLMQMVKLFLIDEVHILKEDRGATLEAVVSRMKSVGSDVRFVALSATVPNSQDIATWLGKDSMNTQIPAPRERFGEEFRPVRLQKHVCGYQSGLNDFAFDKLLNGKLIEVITKWSQRKPLMVFCFTRKSCSETAKLLTTWWKSKGPRDRYWSTPRNHIAVGDKELREVIPAGVAFHHAGLTVEDRTAVEKGYLQGEINVICCTSTLALGINLPCHMVIIKNTVTYLGNNGTKEYSDLEIMQMLGRAGRPQFDDSAVAVIMTRIPKVKFYEEMISGQEVLESCLHLNLIDHLNAEIDLGTVTSAASAKKWLTGTFLYVRLRDNPDHYKIADDTPDRNSDDRLENICKKGIALLQENDLVRGSSELQCTDFGEAMARYCLQFETMKHILALPRRAKMSEILSAVSKAAEYKDVRFRAREKPVYKDLNKNSSIKFPIPVNIDSQAHKVSLIIQSVLGAVDLPTEDDKVLFEYGLNKITVFQHASRLIRCIIDCQLYLEDSFAARHALMLARSFGAQVWDDSPLHIKQLESVGPVAVRKLVAAGIKSILERESIDPRRIESILRRNPPYGALILERASAFPQLRISMKIVSEPVLKKGEGVTLKIKAEIGFINEKIPETFNRKPVYVCLLVDTSDGRLIHFARISGRKLNKAPDVLFSADLTSGSQAIRGFLMCDEIAGTQQSATLKPEIPDFMFPTPKAGDETAKQQNLILNTPNTSKPRAVAASQPRHTTSEDEYGDAGIDDSDLAAVVDADGFTIIDDLDDFDDKSNLQKTMTAKTNASQRTKSLETRETRQLNNGKWACNHWCKDKTVCKHMCCREGLDKKPKPPKPKEAKKSEAASDPKQTQLDLTKTKIANSSTSMAPPASAAPVRKTDSSKGSPSLERLPNSIKSSTGKVPLLKGLAPNQPLPNPSAATQARSSFLDTVRHPPDDSASSDYGLDSLDPGHLPENKDLTPTAPESHRSLPVSAEDANEVDDEMLDIADDESEAKADPGSADECSKLSSLSQHAGYNYLDWDAAGRREIKSNPQPTDTYNAKLPASTSSRLFVTDEGRNNDPLSTIGYNAMKHPLEVIKAVDDNFFKPPKKARPSSHTPRTPFPDEAEDTKLLDDKVMADMTSTKPIMPLEEPNIEEPNESIKNWFYKEFGDELFYFKD